MTERDTPSRTVNFAGGLVGFPDLRRFEVSGGHGAFLWLRSLDDDTRFVITDAPTDYAEQVSPGKAVFVIVNLHDNTLTANLAAPLVIDYETGEGEQLIVRGEGCGLREPIASGAEAGRGGTP